MPSRPGSTSFAALGGGGRVEVRFVLEKTLKMLNQRDILKLDIFLEISNVQKSIFTEHLRSIFEFKIQILRPFSKLNWVFGLDSWIKRLCPPPPLRHIYMSNFAVKFSSSLRFGQE
jgi:hypothetical protein